MIDTPEPKRAYQLDSVQRAAQITIEQILRDVALRKWCVEQAIQAGANGGSIGHDDIYKFVTRSAVEFLEGLGYVVKPDSSEPSS